MPPLCGDCVARNLSICAICIMRAQFQNRACVICNSDVSLALTLTPTVTRPWPWPEPNSNLTLILILAKSRSAFCKLRRVTNCAQQLYCYESLLFYRMARYMHIILLQSCRHFNDSGACVKYCPPERIYNSVTCQWEENPQAKFAYLNTCIKDCRTGKLITNTIIVRFQ